MIKGLEIGQEFTVISKEREDGCGGYGKLVEKENRYVIIGIYPFIILCQEKETNHRRCFNIGDLIRFRMIRQEDEIEAKRLP